MSQAGYQKVIQVKTTGATAYSQLPAHTATLNIPRTLLDDTDFTSTGWMSRLAGLKDYNFTFSAYYGSTNAALGVVRSALLNATKLDVQYLPNGTAGFYGQIYVENLNYTGAVAGQEGVDGTLQSNGTALTTV